ncbi:MAG: 50S ribosomal protein L23 [Planctomycetia bacterium]|jgi:large subunit ribosomal protein L23|nr:50S ribosomal protein L23 [Planctomycetia bacterium]
MAVPVPPPPAFTPRLSPHQVILRPLVTEKGIHRATRHNAYTFEVVTEANKADIRRAVEELFSVKVEKVAVQNRIGKMRRSRMRRTSTKAWKKAVVTLKPDFKINLF